MTNDFFEIRQICPDDKIPIQAGLSLLSPESIRQRFFANKTEFSEAELKFLTEVDQVNHLAYVAVHHKDGSLLPAGVIRAVKSHAKASSAEIGIVIVDCYQGRGLGMRLFDVIAEQALKVGISEFYGDYHVSNLKMAKLLKKFARKHHEMKIKHTHDGFIYFEAPLKNC